ncbi:MAG: UvrD-helicase domain-containing protein, partial [Nitrospinota bacterium]
MNVLIYNELETKKVSKQFRKIVEMIKRDDFRSAEVKKLSNGDFYRARLDYENRLLFRIVRWKGEKYALLLEIIFGHKYERSRFLKGHQVDESKIGAVDAQKALEGEAESLNFLNNRNNRFHVLNKIISFDDEQNSILNSRPPSIIIGSAGSGKTALTLEKIKSLHGDVLYVTHSPYLVDNSRNQYYAFNYKNDSQQVDFLSFREFMETIEIPTGKELKYSDFSSWFSKHSHHSKINDCHKLFEEFNGVLTGASVDKPLLSREDYLNLGVRQSIFPQTERNQVYDFFEKYRHFLKAESFYDTNILSFEYLSKVRECYDFIVVDEVQDLTNKQLTLILKSLRSDDQFILCGDSNQIVHPNFFSWANIKTLFYKKNQKSSSGSEISLVNILFNNYRNSPEVTDLANKLLVLKNRRFGSIDKETNYLVRSISEEGGKVDFFNEEKKILNELNSKTKKSTKFAIVVMRAEDKGDAKKYFNSPLVFSIHEAKGLEYENIILFNFVSNN